MTVDKRFDLSARVKIAPLLSGVLVLSLSVIAPSAYATPPPKNVVTEYQIDEYSEAELAQMLAPIALYPDSLLGHILIAATYPLEVVEAARWQEDHKDLRKTKRAELIDQQDWAPSVKVLIGFPMVLSRMSDDLSWTRELGDAFLQDEAKVLASVQDLRHQAKLAGTLAELDKVDVEYQDKTIILQPAKKEIVYVPYYDSRHVYGDWRWRHHSPIYWHNRIGYRYGNHYHRHRGHLGWYSGVDISFNFFFNAVNWHNRYVVVNLPRHYSYRIHRNHHRYYGRHALINDRHTRRWQHNPYHRRSVSYGDYRTRAKYLSSSSSGKKYRSSKKRDQHYANSRYYRDRKHVSRYKNKKYRHKDKAYNRVTSSTKIRKVVKQPSKYRHKTSRDKNYYSAHKKVIKRQQVKHKYRTNKKQRSYQGQTRKVKQGYRVKTASKSRHSKQRYKRRE
ncbi:DUF3300 domain-containing protein [Endozoicomonas sp. G2_1]|uniref:DUF3300 domain-containing protein n=1 Tax=Endozoicomonas sp. G2_1 TaxID=2821091 RepID=UPI001ADBFB62|nr:DUF3300 domain-containing protein [Endozoicomonas sp. G2_1]MBO9490295.1 DUF3300 domain-containing protein [Endozoicomonas sp. G2_1]